MAQLTYSHHICRNQNKNSSFFGKPDTFKGRTLRLVTHFAPHRCHIVQLRPWVHENHCYLTLRVTPDSIRNFLRCFTYKYILVFVCWFCDPIGGVPSTGEAFDLVWFQFIAQISNPTNGFPEIFFFRFWWEIILLLWSQSDILEDPFECLLTNS